MHVDEALLSIIILYYEFTTSHFNFFTLSQEASWTFHCSLLFASKWLDFPPDKSHPPICLSSLIPPSLTCPCAPFTSAACCRLSATCAAMTRCRSTTSRQQAQRQSLQRQKRLWPLRHDTTPWFRQRAHLGLRVILRGFCCWRSDDGVALVCPPPSPGLLPSRPAHPSGLVTSTTSSDCCTSGCAASSCCRPPSSWEDI